MNAITREEVVVYKHDGRSLVMFNDSGVHVMAPIRTVGQTAALALALVTELHARGELRVFGIEDEKLTEEMLHAALRNAAANLPF